MRREPPTSSIHIMIRFVSRFRPAGALLACLLLTCGGCSIYRNMGTGAHMDAPREHPHDPNGNRVREMVVEVTTDPEGNVVDIHFQRSSGSDGVDGYVAQSIHEQWPRQPSTRSVASISYSRDKGFSTPKIISSTPAQ